MTLTMAAVLGCGQAKPTARTASVTRRVAAVNITSMTATPASISFTSTDPDLGAVSGSASATVDFALATGVATNTWTLKISSATATFTGGTCTTIPASAITATCASVTVTNFGGAGTGACAAASTLSTAGTTLGTGLETSSFAQYAATINFKLTDSWSYIAATSPTCPLSITYSLTAP
jgi:hypothetical protein